MNRSSLPVLLLAGLIGATSCSDDSASGITSPAGRDAVRAASAVEAGRAFAVAGEAVHYFTTAAVHSSEPTDAGMIQRSSEIIRLTGDLDGYILYHPTSVFDFVAGTLVNTGTQVFSGTVRGSEPLLLHDDAYRFQVELASGATVGEVHLGRSLDAPAGGHWFECDLEVTGTGATPEGDGLARYEGTCREFGRAPRAGGA